MIRVENLSKRFGSIHAIRNVSFHVRRGEVLGFLGPNGAGKTTTMRILTGFLSPTSGKVFIDEIDIEKHPLKAKQRIGYLSEVNPLYSYMTPRAFLKFVARAKGVAFSERRKQIEQVVEQCRIKDVFKRKISKLSKGYRQRVGLAQVLLGDPDIIVLDEPTSGLDPAQIIEIRELIRSLKGRKTVIVSTHILPEVNQVSDRVVIINDGLVVAEGGPHDLADKLRPYEELELIVQGTTGLLDLALKRIDGFISYEVKSQTGEILHLAVRFEKGRDVRAQLSREMMIGGFKLLELRSSGLSLEEVYLRVVSSGDVMEVAK